MSTKLVKYKDEKYQFFPTASYNRGAYITVEEKNGIAYINYTGIVQGLPPKISYFYQGAGFKHKLKTMRTVGDLSSNGEQYGFIGVLIGENGDILINASNAPAGYVELRFSIVTPIQE